MRYISTIASFSFVALGAMLPSALTAQEADVAPLSTKPTIEYKRSWEIGVGGAMLNWNRVTVNKYTGDNNDIRYRFNIQQLMGGAGLYVARELSPWFYIDLQGNILFEKNKTTDKYDMLYMAGPGLQLRLSPLFGRRYVEPYLRVGAYYMGRNFDAANKGAFAGDPTNVGKWEVTEDTWGKAEAYKGRDGYFPLSFGAGVQGWFNDRFGLGLQGEYIMPVQKDMPRFAQLTTRLLFRLGGSTKRPAPVVVNNYVDRIVVKEVPKEVVKFVDAPEQVSICNLLEGVYFDFDKDVIKAESYAVLDDVATLLKKEDTSARFLLIGFTDARGTVSYNKDLSTRRAKAVYDALIERGVPREMLAYVGVGKMAALAPVSKSHIVREGDRKVTIERISSPEYWQKVINL